MSTRKSKVNEAKFETGWDRRGPCGYVGCTTRGLVRQYTITGWINLCAAHYEQWHAEHYRELAPRPTDNPTMLAIREAYQSKLLHSLPIPSREAGSD